LLKGVKVDDLDGGTDDQKGYKALLHGIMPDVRYFNNFQEEVSFIAEYIEKIKNETGSIKEVCLVARTNNLLKHYESAISAKGFEIYLVRRSEAEDFSSPGLRLATMHRVKGLEFDRVIIAGVNEGVVPFEGAQSYSSDTVVKRESEVQERALLYVSATRAKKEVVVTSFGKSSRFLSNL
jgi:DNA helicase IV